MSGIKVDLAGVFETIREELKRVGIDLESVAEDVAAAAEGTKQKVKVVCVTPDLRKSRDEMSRATRDQVVMVRIDDATSKTLDAWVETGAVKSRSEAAALFIREGLKVRATELEQLESALADVERARDRLKDRARQVFGEDEPEAARDAE